jgi:MFS family permease
MLSNPYVRSILLSNVLLQLGIWIRNFAILLYVADLTGNNPYYVSLIYIVEMAPIFVFSMIGGTFADRWKPKKTMVWCDFLSAVSVFVVLLAMIYAGWQAVFLATFVSAILSQFSQPSAMKLFKLHVAEDRLQSVMAMFQSFVAIFMVIGPVIGTFVYQRFGIEISIAIMGTMFLCSALVLVRLPRDPEKESAGKGPGFVRELARGLRYVWDSRVLKTMLVNFAAAGLAVGLIQPLGIFVVMENLGKDKDFLQWLLAANGVAMLAGGGMIMAISRRIKPQQLLALGMTVGAVCTMIVGWSHNVPLTIAAQIVNGLFFPSIHVGLNTMILQNASQEFVGRVMGALNPMFMGLMVVGMSTSGALKEALTLPWVHMLSGGLFLLGVMALVPLFRLAGGGAPLPAQQMPVSPQSADGESGSR